MLLGVVVHELPDVLLKAPGEYRVRDGVSVGFGVAGAAPVAGDRDGDLINYADVRTHSDVELQSTKRLTDNVKSRFAAVQALRS